MVEQDDARTQAIEYVAGIAASGTAVVSGVVP
jgi:hypothetical protein